MRCTISAALVLSLLASTRIATSAFAAEGDPGSGDAATSDAATASNGCPVTWLGLRNNLRQAVSQVHSGSMWGVAVNRDGVVCAVAFSRKTRFDELRLSRQIAAAKAFTADGLSLNGEPFGTAQLYADAQPGASAYHVEFANPVDVRFAYGGSPSRYGTANDPMDGHIVGGTIPFGGGVPLGKGANIIGAVGVSGDTACRDDQVVRKLRDLLGLKPSGNDGEGLACKGS
jgi:uncharacterized protein GlcG (DUF336 family)